MKIIRAGFAIGVMVLGTRLGAVYAPIPTLQQGDRFSVSVEGGVTYDSNIFGSRTDEIDSLVYRVAPTLTYNASVSDQTFFSSSYGLTGEEFTDRPGQNRIFSHSIFARLAHAFSPTTTLDVADTYARQKNPESLLAGLPVNTNQSFKSNEFNLTLGTAVGPRVDVTGKVRLSQYRYDSPTLASSIDRNENLFGVEAGMDLLPELFGSLEYRYLDVGYRSGGSTKDKTSDYYLGGLRYQAGEQLGASLRAGVESRQRSGEGSTTVPYVELTGTYDYAQGSFLSAGYIYTLEETSNVTLYNDIQVNRIFANVQHLLTDFITVSASFTYEPSTLRGRRGFPSRSDDTTRAGLAATWQPAPNWQVSATYDYDKVDSADTSRNMDRDRVALNAFYSF